MLAPDTASLFTRLPPTRASATLNELYKNLLSPRDDVRTIALNLVGPQVSALSDQRRRLDPICSLERWCW